MNLPVKILPGEVLGLAEKYMKPEEIDHHGLGHGMDDLYLKVTPVSKEIAKRTFFNSAITTFVDNIDHELWYEFPFCYWKRGDEHGIY